MRALSLVKAGKAAKFPPPGGVGRPCWFFHRSADPRLSYLRGDAEQALAIKALSGEHAESHVQRAALRLKWLRVYWNECRTASRGETKRSVAERVVAEARAAEGSSFLISRGAIETWQARYRRVDPATGKIGGVDALIDRYAERRSLSAHGVPIRNRSPEAVEFFYILYRTGQRLTVVMCHEATLHEGKGKGWKWPASVRATEVWLEKNDDREFTLLCREGTGAHAHRGMAYIEQDYEQLAPGQMYVCDHHQCKYFVLVDGKPVRPWLTAVMDMRTRVIVGWHLGVAPHSGAILQSLHAAFTVWGVPIKVKIDNGGDYTSKVLTGITKAQARQYKRKFGSEWKETIKRERSKVDVKDSAWFGVLPELGCEIVYALPYQPWSKPIERLFLTFTDRHARTRASFCATDATQKPEGLHQVLAMSPLTRGTIGGGSHGIPTLDQEREAIGEYIDLYHATPHTGDAMHMRSPFEVWKSIESVARVAERSSLDLLMTVRGLYKVGANGVRVRIGGTDVGYGQYNNKLKAFKDREVLVAIDPANIDEAVILTADKGDRRVVCRVPRNAKISPDCAATEQQMRDAQAEVNRERRLRKRVAANAGRAMQDAAAVLDRQRRERVTALRATGTHGKPTAHPDQVIRVVHTGIEMNPNRDSYGAASPGVPTGANFDAAPNDLRPSFEDLFDADDVAPVASDFHASLSFEALADDQNPERERVGQFDCGPSFEELADSDDPNRDPSTHSVDAHGVPIFGTRSIEDILE